MSAALEDLLDHVQEALIAGELSRLVGLDQQIQTLTAQLPRLDRPSAERLRRKADRNARLLLAAQRGIKAARQRLADIGSAAELSTYDARGRREVISAPSAFLPRRV